MKNLKISDKAHQLLKLYCVENSLRMNEYASVMIVNIISQLRGTQNGEPAGLHEDTQSKHT
jgi:hypothetical protein